MDAIKQQVEPVSASVQPQVGNGWRNLALLFGFSLALLLGFVLALWWQSANALPLTASKAPTPQAEPALADRASIVAALVSAPREVMPELLSAPVVAKPAQPKQDEFKPEPKVVSVTAPVAVQQPVTTEVASVATPEPDIAVSDELRQRFASAMAASEVSQQQPSPRAGGAPAKDINTLAPALQQQIPSLRFEAHVYATQSQQRWVKVNGKSLQEGQWVTADVRLKEITPQFVLLEMGTELFSIPALTDYK